jgi:hypothetical protein
MILPETRVSRPVVRALLGKKRAERYLCRKGRGAPPCGREDKTMPIRLSVLALLAALSVAPLALRAETAPAAATAEAAATATAQVAALSEALRVGEILDVMRAEGLDYAVTLQDELFAGQGGSRWQDQVSRIYDVAAMRQRFDAVLQRELAADGALVDQMTAFFTGEPGSAILTLELEARRALLDSAVEDAAKVLVQDLTTDKDPRLDQLRRFAEVNDLVEANVMGAMNANLAFYQGMSEGGAFGGAMAEADMLAEVWGQEAEVRAETTEWLYSYLALAYQPLPDADLDAYIAFSESPAGQRLNAALFAAFDAVFGRLSNDLGRAAATQIGGQDI